jgi:ubiquitin C-terminal hydrolase
MPGQRASQRARTPARGLPRLSFVPSRNPAGPKSSLAPAPSHLPSDCPETAERVTALPVSASLTFPSVSRHFGGLHNNGNTCYLNSTLQAILHTPALHSIALAHLSVASESFGHSSRFCALCSLATLSKSLVGTKQALTPSMFASPAALRAVSTTLKPGRQEDAHEYLRALLNAALRADLLGCGAAAPKAPLPHAREMRSTVHGACGGILQSGVRCHSCHHESVTLEPFLDLSVGTAPTLQRALAAFTAPDLLDGNNMYRCEACRKKVIASKRLNVRTAPNSLTIHLKRFDGMRKDRSAVRYPAVLDLAPYMVPATPPSRGKEPRKVPNSVATAAGVAAGAAIVEFGQALLYDLVAVLVHDGGGTRSGHYFSYVKGSNGTWALKNDSSTSMVPESRALNQQAYILFYSRQPTAVPRGRPRMVLPINVDAQRAVEANATDQCANFARAPTPETSRNPDKTVEKAVAQELIIPIFDRSHGMLPSSSAKPPPVLFTPLGMELVVHAAKMADPTLFCAHDNDSIGDTSSGMADSASTDLESALGQGNMSAVIASVKPATLMNKKHASKAKRPSHDRISGLGIASDDIDVGVAGSDSSRSSDEESSREDAELSRTNSLVHTSEPQSRANSSITTPVRAFIAGGSRAVRKLAQRIRRTVANDARAQEGMCVRGNGLGLRPDVVFDSENDNGNNNNYVFMSPNEDAAANRQRGMRITADTFGTEMGTGGVAFCDQGIGGWNESDTGASSKPTLKPLANKVGVQTRPLLQKRARARDLGDADYDRGKAKKIKRIRSEPRAGMRLEGHGAGILNPFQSASERCIVVAADPATNCPSLSTL